MYVRNREFCLPKPSDLDENMSPSSSSTNGDHIVKNLYYTIVHTYCLSWPREICSHLEG